MRAVRVCLFAAALTVSTQARAAGTSFADREAARNLAGKGYEALEAGQYKRAIELFEQAEARFHAPPHWLYMARAQIKLGRLLEAKASLEHIADEKLAADAPAPFKEAQASARTELRDLEPKIPSLTVVIEGEAPPGARVLVDDVPLKSEDLGHPVRRNPGPHLIKGEAPGFPAVERTVVLEAGGGDAARVSLPFIKRGSPYIVPAAVSFSLGAVGIGVGVTTAILSLNAKESAKNNLRIGEITGFAVGGAGIIAGIVLVAVRPKPSVATTPLNVGIGPGSLTITGQF
jgi:hypothetical protein